MKERYAHGLGVLIAGLLPLLLLAPALPVAAPIVSAGWQRYLSPIAGPLHGAFARIGWLIPLGSDGLRESMIALALVCAACASLFVLLDVAIARATRAFDLAALLRAPLALGVAWALIGLAVFAEPVVVRMGPLAMIVAVAAGCFAVRLRFSTDRLIAVLERARGRASGERKPSPLALAASCTFMVLGAVYLRVAAQHAGDLRSDAGEALREALTQRAAPHTVLFVDEVLTASSARSVQAARPDIELFDVSVLFDVKNAEALAMRRPELTPLIRASLLGGALNGPELQAFAVQRPVRLALPLPLLAPVREVLVPAGLFSEVASSTVTDGDLNLARTSNDSYMQTLLGELALGELDSATRGFVREQCVLTAALLSPLARGAYLAEYLDRARLLTRDESDAHDLVGALNLMAIPAAVGP
jgi:hypothetical protein